jgi:hypothetical protein
MPEKGGAGFGTAWVQFSVEALELQECIGLQEFFVFARC